VPPAPSLASRQLRDVPDVKVMNAATSRSSDMSNSRLRQVWLGILGLVVGFAVLFSGLVTSHPAPRASDAGITITVLNATSTR
jgi:hypothetical protein